ncbi:membrane protein insertion efficiency factor YidD [Rickettsia endosymbiont of Urophora cardui]|uniref:membrane protein insertion efficiency factor YidD n=1 Tax=Rickettsia endosymbiont of Urophora cardui TaxID=3066265 RepID=UPI00313B6E8F
MSKIILLLIRFYQYFISPLLGNNCRFYPTCSDYAKDAITSHGNIKGLWLAIKRIIKCQPLCDGGYDPVPISIKNSKISSKKI